MYAIHNGDRMGGFFIYIKEEDRGNARAVLSMPDMEALYIKKEEIKTDLKFENIKHVQKIPRDVYAVCKVNFVYYAKKAGIYGHR